MMVQCTEISFHRLDDGFNWPLYGSIIGLSVLAALLLCWCFCGLYIWFVLLRLKFLLIVCLTSPSIDTVSKYATNGKPVLYNIEPNADFDCSWSDTFDSLDTSIGPFMNIDRSFSSTPKLSDNASTIAIRDFDHDCSSIVSSNQDSNVPLVHVFLPRFRTFRSESNTCIKSTTHRVISEQNPTPHRLEPKTLVRVSRIRPATHEIRAHTAPEMVRVSRMNDPIRSVVVRSPRITYINEYDQSDSTLYSLSDEPRFSSEGHRTVQSISSLPSISSRIRVERKRRILIRNLLPSFIIKKYQRK